MRRPRHLLLRSATAAVHREVEAAVERARFFEGASAYGDYLRRAHLFNASLSRSLAHAAVDLAERWKIGEHARWLAADLESLGLSPLREGAEDMRAPNLDNRSAACGALYVTLGSGLGARVLLARARRLAMPGGAGLTYLTALAVGTEWVPFLEQLEAEPDLATSSLAAGAIRTFESVFDHLTRSLPQ